MSEVGALADLPLERAAGATRALAQAEIIRPDPPLGFVHPLVREAVYRDLPPGELEVAHARAARLLIEAGASSQRVAAHLLLAPPEGRPEVVETLRAAADEALKAGGAESAGTYLRRALDEPPTRTEAPRSCSSSGSPRRWPAPPRPQSACATPTRRRPTRALAASPEPR